MCYQQSVWLGGVFTRELVFMADVQKTQETCQITNDSSNKMCECHNLRKTSQRHSAYYLFSFSLVRQYFKRSNISAVKTRVKYNLECYSKSDKDTAQHNLRQASRQHVQGQLVVVVLTGKQTHCPLGSPYNFSTDVT